MDKLYIVIPAYNEEASIEKVAREWHKVAAKVGGDSRLLILNDGSKDGTLSVLRQLENQLGLLEIIDKPNSGHGPTCLYGYKQALQNGADYVFQTDADGQTLPSDFWPFWEHRGQHDFIIGYRTSRGDGLMRWVISRVLRCVLYLIFGVYVKDANVPFRLMKAGALQKYLPQIPENFYLANALLPVLLVRGKENILWQKIGFVERINGKASVPLKKMAKVGWKVTKDFIKFRKSYEAR
jgi:glycosyltransferase involved in cell wall biosynthesis